MTTDIANLLPNLIAHAIAMLDKATTAAEVLEARNEAAFAFDQAKAAERLAKARGRARRRNHWPSVRCRPMR